MAVCARWAYETDTPLQLCLECSRHRGCTHAVSLSWLELRAKVEALPFPLSLPPPLLPHPSISDDIIRCESPHLFMRVQGTVLQSSLVWTFSCQI